MGHREQLRAEVLRAGWDELAPHFARGALLVLAGELDLLDVAVAIASDDTPAVTAWLADGRLRRASDPEAAAWAESKPVFQAVILQPWVLAQHIAQ
jgi:hypothetical protein